MTTGNLYLDIFIAGLIGIFIHAFGVKYPAIKQRAEKANVSVSFMDYIKKDYPSLIVSLLTVFGLMICIDELTGKWPILEDIKKILAIFVGYAGSSIVLRGLSRTEKYVLNIIDKKTDIADNK